jgi:hypothetical protein
VIEVAELLFFPLGQAVYVQDVRRGSMLRDGIVSMFVGDDVSRAQVLSIQVIGEVKQMHFNCFNGGHTVLLLGRPSLCVAVTNLFWQQQVREG